MSYNAGYENIKCIAKKCSRAGNMLRGARYRGVIKCSGCPSAINIKTGKPYINPEGKIPHLSQPVICPTCRGEKTLDIMTLEGKPAVCPTCNGTGIKPRRRPF